MLVGKLLLFTRTQNIFLRLPRPGLPAPPSACAVWEMATGGTPFAGMRYAEIVYKVGEPYRRMTSLPSRASAPTSLPCPHHTTHHGQHAYARLRCTLFGLPTCFTSGCRRGPAPRVPGARASAAGGHGGGVLGGRPAGPAHFQPGA